MAIDSALPVRDGFRLRGTSVSRLETFVDAAFAFGVTLVVISVGALPGSVPELLEALKHVPAFAACFLLLTMLWSGHDEWSRRYGIENDRTSWLSLLFVFVMLVWVFPLRMVFSAAFEFFTNGWLKSGMNDFSSADLQNCFLIYGIGFASMSAILLQLNREALRTPVEPPLDPIETLETRRAIGAYAVHVGVAFISILLSFAVRNAQSNLLAALPGFAYMLTGVGLSWHHRRFHKLRAKLETA
jgi:uncharacterized membrane protein